MTKLTKKQERAVRSDAKRQEAADELFTAPETPPAPVGHSPGPWRAESEKHPYITDGNVWWRVYAGPEDHADLVAHCDRTTRNPMPGTVTWIGRTADPKPSDIERDAANAP